MVHEFCDASKEAYAAVIYVVGVGKLGTVSEFVLCKTKVAPLKPLSIPKLELCACLLLTTMMMSVKNAFQHVLKVTKWVCWSDSLDSLYWIKDH